MRERDITDAGFLHLVGAMIALSVTCPRLLSQALCESGVGVVPL